MYISVGMIDISTPNLKPSKGTIATLQAAAPTAAKNTIKDRKTLRIQKRETNIAQTTDGSRRKLNEFHS